MRSIAPLACVLLLAGCSASTGTETTAPPSSSLSAPPELQVALSGCQGFHTFFPSPATLFEDLVPDNFTLDTDESGGLVDIPVFGYDCANGTIEIWALLPVIPPEVYRNASYAVDAVILQGFTTNATFHAQYMAWGLDPAFVLHATVREQEYNDDIVARDDRLALGTPSIKYSVHTVVPADQAPFDQAAYRYWAVQGTTAIGWLDVQANASTGLGAGSAAFEQQGDPAAPPASTGVGHRVEGAALTVTWHPVKA